MTKLASYLSYLSGSFGENREVLSIEKIHEKRRKVEEEVHTDIKVFLLS